LRECSKCSYVENLWLKAMPFVTSTDLTIEEMKRERDSRNHTAHPRNLATTRLPCLRRVHRIACDEHRRIVEGPVLSLSKRRSRR